MSPYEAIYCLALLMGDSCCMTRELAHNICQLIHNEYDTHDAIYFVLNITDDIEVIRRMSIIQDNYYHFGKLPSLNKIDYANDEDRNKYTAYMNDHGHNESEEYYSEFTTADYVKELFNRGWTRKEIYKLIFKK
jgi:hypothetical protein